MTEFSSSSAGCLPISLSTILTDTSGNSSSDGTSSLWKRRRLANLTELEAEIRANTNLVCAGDEQVQSVNTYAMIRSHRQCGVTWSAFRFLFNWSRRSGTVDAEESGC